MTLVLAVKWVFDIDNEGVLITADTQATTSIGIQYDVRKIKEIFTIDEKPIAILGGAGDPTIIKWAFRASESIFIQAANNEYPLCNNSFNNTIREIEKALLVKISDFKRFNITLNFQMIIGGVTKEGKALIYQFDRRGLVEPVHDDPGYAIIGHGFLTGGALLLRLLGYDPMALDLGLLTAFILDVVSEVDTTVGPFVGDSYLMSINQEMPQINGILNFNLGPLQEEMIPEFRERIKKRRQLILHLWSLCDIHGEKKVENVLDSLLEVE